MQFDALCLIPPMIVIILGILTRRAFEPLLIGCLAGFLLIDPGDFPGNFIEALKKTLENEDMVWVILVCGLYGSLMHLIIQSGGVFAFGNYALRYVRTRRNALIMTWLLGLFIFIDDWLSVLATGITMRKITDRYQVSREMLAYLANAMAAPICVLVPLTTWSIYIGKLLEDNHIVGKGGGFDGFLAILPFMFYAWAVVAIALLVALGKFPLFKKMRIAEARALSGGPLAPSNSGPATTEDAPVGHQNAKPAYFFLPLIVLIIATIWLDKDALKGVMAGLAFTFFYYWIAGVMRVSDLTDGIFEGFKSMVFALAILTMAFVLKKVGSNMGLTPYVIQSVTPYLSIALLPAVIFVALSFVTYAMASAWGVYAISIPIIVPLASAMGANVWVSLAAVICAGVFGAQSSFYSDLAILTATSTECNNMELSFAQLPYNLIAAAVATGLFLVCGFYL